MQSAVGLQTLTIPILALGYLTHVYVAHSWLDRRRDHDSDSPVGDRFLFSTSGNAKFQDQIDPPCRPLERATGTRLERSQAIAVSPTGALITSSGVALIQRIWSTGPGPYPLFTPEATSASDLPRTPLPAPRK
jgi:hypothetical protein